VAPDAPPRAGAPICAVDVRQLDRWEHPDGPRPRRLRAGVPRGGAPRVLPVAGERRDRADRPASGADRAADVPVACRSASQRSRRSACASSSRTPRGSPPSAS
jgi:hypothetical protein